GRAPRALQPDARHPHDLRPALAGGRAHRAGRRTGRLLARGRDALRRRAPPGPERRVRRPASEHGRPRGGPPPAPPAPPPPVPAGAASPLMLPVVGGDSIVVTRGRFMVDGWVAKPGLYTFTPGMTAYGAMSVAGGVLYPASLGHTQIIRSRRDGSKELLEVDLGKVGDGEGQDVALPEGDVVYFPASAVRMVPYSVYWVFNNLFRVGAGISVAGV